MASARAATAPATETVTTKAGSVVTSGSSGIVAVNRSICSTRHASTITVNAYGDDQFRQQPESGRQYAGRHPGRLHRCHQWHQRQHRVNGTVIVNNYANITASVGYGIDAYNYGNGDVTVNSFAGTTISVSGSESSASTPRP